MKTSEVEETEVSKDASAKKRGQEEPAIQGAKDAPRKLDADSHGLNEARSLR
jgi:hypothetical protein